MSNLPLGIVAIVGRANVGKSSLFNAIVGHREAIVAKEAGTTRDRLIFKAHYGKKDFWIVDTAGTKHAEDDFELTIQDQIAQAAAAAQVIIVVVDSNVNITSEDRQVATLAMKTGKPVALAVNKVDAGKRIDIEPWKALGIKHIVPTSAIHRSGINELLEQVSTHLPDRQLKHQANLIRLAILGRPNVGKSSLFNALGGEQRAVVAEEAGTTRDVNRLAVNFNNQAFEVLDTAGIRRSGKIERGVEKFSVLRALAAIEEADVCALVIDATEPSVKLDQKIAGLIKDGGKGLILVLNKWDKIEDKAVAVQAITNQLKADYAFAAWAPLVFTSAKTGQNSTKLFDLAAQIAQNRKQKFKTADLNRWLQTAVRRHPPAGIKNLQPSLSYITQEVDQPLPSFKVFGAEARALHWSYRRYLERSFRQSWPCEGTPINFWLTNKKAS